MAALPKVFSSELKKGNTIEDSERSENDSSELDLLYLTCHEAISLETEGEDRFVFQRSTIPNNIKRSSLVSGFDERKYVYAPATLIDMTFNVLGSRLTALASAKITDPAPPTQTTPRTVKSQPSWDFVAADKMPMKDLCNPKEMNFTLDYLMNIVRTSSVIAVMCLATLSGFGSDKEKQLTENFIKAAVTYDEDSPEVTKYIANLKRKVESGSLSTFNFNVLSYFPFENPIWILATKRTSISLCFISCLALALRHRNVPLENLAMDEAPGINDTDTHGQKHLKWLFLEFSKRLEFLKEHRKEIFPLLEIGLTLATVLSGNSKATKEILPFFIQYCHRFITLALKKEVSSPKTSQILKLASRKRSVIFIDTPSEQQQDEHGHLKVPADTDLIDLYDATKLKKKVEKIVVDDLHKFVDTIPLRWVFIHSLMLSLEISLMRRSDISKLALSCDVGMSDSEVEVFLNTFTSFGSLLYIPSLTDVVLVNIEQFTDCLDTIYSYDNEYGLISETAIDRIIDEKKLDITLFKKVLIAYHFALPITKSKIISAPLDQSFYYNVPSMRTSQPIDCRQFDSLFLHINGNCISGGNMQVFLLRHFLKLSNCFLHPFAPVNASLIDVQCKDKEWLQIKVIDHEYVVEIRLDVNEHSDENIDEICSLIFKACNTLLVAGDFQCKIIFPCADEQGYHSEEENEDTTTCDKCEQKNNNEHEVNRSLRKSWNNFISKMKSDFTEQTQFEDFFTPEEWTSLAVRLSKFFIDDKGKQILLKTFGKQEQGNGYQTTELEGWETFLACLMSWKKEEKFSSRKDLEEKLKTLNFYI